MYEPECMCILHRYRLPCYQSGISFEFAKPSFRKEWVSAKDLELLEGSIEEKMYVLAHIRRECHCNRQALAECKRLRRPKQVLMLYLAYSQEHHEHLSLDQGRN